MRPAVRLITSYVPPVVAPPSDGMVTRGLVAQYKFDDGSGQVLTDYGGNSRHGQLGSTTGADADDPTWSAAGLVFNTAMVAKCASIPDLITGAYSVEAVISATSTSRSEQPLVALAGDSGLYLNLLGNSRVLFYLGGGNFRYFSWVVDTGPHHIVFVIPGAGQSDIDNSVFYVDGVSQEVYSTNSGSAQDAKTVFNIGKSSTYSLAGTVNYMIVRDVAMTSQEVSDSRAYLTTALASRGVTLP